MEGKLLANFGKLIDQRLLFMLKGVWDLFSWLPESDGATSAQRPFILWVHFTSKLVRETKISLLHGLLIVIREKLI